MSSGDGNCCFEDPLTGDFVSDEQSEHDVGQPTAQCPQRLGLGVTGRHPSLDVAATGPDLRHCVTPIRCSAALTCRLPPRLRRKRSLFDDHTGMGAVPFQRARDICGSSVVRRSSQ